ncbi:MAG TPA: Lrp/AsnC family transcriptional regulator [Candidatus Thermoplasmatota archaeon]|nr:Lrp/AsnC family transcriptional regulator [Candidatus Thermoplasmatota archaeon]
MALDALDRKILALLQEDARASVADLARAIDRAPSVAHERLRRLEERGLVKAYEARLDEPALGFSVVAFVLVEADDLKAEAAIGRELQRVPEVQEVHHVAGEGCFLLKVRARDNAHLGQVLTTRVQVIPHVTGTRTTIVLDTLKETTRLPLQGGPPPTG